jgi:hypothetical protein
MACRAAISRRILAGAASVIAEREHHYHSITRAHVGSPDIHSRSFTPTGKRIPGLKLDNCLVFLKLFERVYAPLTAGLLSPVKGDAMLHSQHRSLLDRSVPPRRRRSRQTHPRGRSEGRLTSPSNANKIPLRPPLRSKGVSLLVY